MQSKSSISKEVEDPSPSRWGMITGMRKTKLATIKVIRNTYLNLCSYRASYYPVVVTNSSYSLCNKCRKYHKVRGKISTNFSNSRYYYYNYNRDRHCRRH